MYRLFFCFLLGFLCVCGQNFQSPCPEYFDYKQDGGGIYGLITVKYFGAVSSVLVHVNFTIRAQLTSSYSGSLQPIGTKMNLLRDFNRGKAMQYKLHFPVVSPLPRVTSITVNNKVVCYGQEDVLGDIQYITRISLQHKLYYPAGTDVRNVYTPQYTPAPTIPSYNSFNAYNGFESGSRNTYINPFTIDNTKLAVTKQRVRPQPQTLRVPTYVITSPTIKAPVPKPSLPMRDSFSTQIKPQSTSKCGINSKTAMPLIYKGVTYDPGEWPWLVAVYRRHFGNLNYICAGTLVSPNHVISAAHCVYRKNTYTNKKNILIKAGIYSLEDWSDDIATRRLKEFFIHDNYNATTLENDILVMTLNKAVPFNAMIQPACLWSGNTVLKEIVGKSGVVAGWGASEQGPGGMGNPRMVTMPVASTEDCRASKSDFHKLTSSTTLCAGDRSGSGPCLGDSGGGLYLLHGGRWRLRGIVSLALISNDERQCDLHEYIIFTDTAQYIPWITRVMST